MNRFLLIIFLVFLGYHASAQQISDSSKFLGRIYSNFHTGISQNTMERSAFEVNRAYLGYSHYLDRNFYCKIMLDIGSPEDESYYSLIKRYAYFKYAYVRYLNNNLRIDFGLISIKQFKHQESIWGHHYIAKSAQDRFSFGSSADIGTSLEYKFNNFVTIDLTLMNGEGYKQLQADNTYKFSTGLTIKPIKNMLIRGYFDTEHKNQFRNTFSSFISYRIKNKYALGLEYNYKMNQNYQNQYNQELYSAYAWYHFHKKWQLFARYDYLKSNIIEEIPWNLLNDGSAVISGIEFRPTKNIKIALNYQDWFPYASNIENRSYLYLNVETRIQ